MQKLIEKQKTLTLAEELYKIANTNSYHDVKDIFIKYEIIRFDVCNIQQLVNLIGIELAERILNKND